MLFIVYFTILLISELIYFRIAEKYSIIDKPNHRSSHSTITIRGGGIIFPLAILLYALSSGFPYTWFISGLLIISLVSFWDDLSHIPNTIRILIHLVAASLLFYQADLFMFGFWISVSCYIGVIGAINAYNFMDGINGITGLYSLTSIITLILINDQIGFIDQRMLIIILLALLVFLFFNFRKKAKCFAGDVGSVSIAFIVIFALALLISQTQQWLYVMFLAVYGADSALTIIHRLLKKENIFKAHRSHVYQLLSNEAGKSHLLVSFAYALLQLIINFIIMRAVTYTLFAQIATAIVIFAALCITYQVIRNRIFMLHTPGTKSHN